MLSANAENPSALWLQAATHAFIGFAKIEVLDYEGAAASAKRGMGAAVKAFDSSLGDNIHLDMYAFAGRCAAYAAIRLCDVREARDVYEEAEAATIFSQGRTTPELLVLKALLSNHEGNDDDAIKYFDKARAQARADGEYPLNFRTRYMIDITPAVIEGRFDKVFELARESILNYGQGAYESWNAVLGAVVAAFMTDSEAAIACSIGLMRDAQSWSLSTIQMERRYFLLSFTPHLGLNLPQRREWLITI
jgi:tetratricopeptide (TPR) repeat protein